MGWTSHHQGSGLLLVCCLNNGSHHLTQALSWDRVASVSYGWVFSPVLAAVGPMRCCTVEWAGLECSLGFGWGMQCGGCRKPDDHYGSPLTTLSALRACASCEQSPGFSQLPITLSSLLTREGGSSPLCRTPGLGRPIRGSCPSLPRVGLCLCVLPFPLSPS